MEANSMTNDRIESLPMSELDHIFYAHTQEKWNRVRASNNFQILKCEEVSIQHTQGQAKETSCKLLRRLTKMKKMPFLKQENLATPIQLHFKEVFGGFNP